MARLLITFILILSQQFDIVSSVCECPHSNYGVDDLEAELKAPLDSQGNYCNSMTCKYIIEAGPAGSAIGLHFDSLDIEAGNLDYVMVSQLKGTRRFPMEKLSGSYPPSSDFVSAEGNGLELLFHSDGSVQRTGFVAKFTRFNVTDDKCACPEAFIDVTASTQTLVSPNSPNRYCNKMQCYHLLKASGSYSVKLSLTSIAMDSQDTVRIYEGDSYNSTQKQRLVTWTGRSMGAVSSSDREIVSKTHSLVVVFRSDSAVGGTGYTASVIQAPHPCLCDQGTTRVAAGSSGYVTSPNYPRTYCDDLECFYRFQTSAGYVIQYFINTMSLHENDWLYVMDTNNGDREIAQYTGNSYNTHERYRTITSNNRQSALKFKTNGYGVRTGFNLTYTSVQRSSSCRCPNPQPREYSQESGSLSFKHSGSNCGAADCIFVLTRPTNLMRVAFNVSVKPTSPWGTLRICKGRMPSPRALNTAHSYTSRSTSTTATVKSDSDITIIYHSQATGSAPSGSGFSIDYRWKESCACGPSEIDADQGGQLTSPDYPDNYCDNLNCLWTIRAPDGYKVKIYVRSFRTEEYSDYLRFYDGDSEHDTRIQSISGYYYSGGLIRSSGSVMTLKFTSDGGVSRQGFRLTYSKESIGTTTRPRTTTRRTTTTTTRRTGTIGQIDEPSFSSPSTHHTWAIVLVVFLVLIAISLIVFMVLYATGRVSLARFGIGTSDTAVGYVRDGDTMPTNGRVQERIDQSRIALMDCDY